MWIHSGFGHLAEFVPRPDYRRVQAFEPSPPCLPFHVAVLLHDGRPAGAGRARPGSNAALLGRLRALVRDTETPAFHQVRARIEQHLGTLGARQRRARVRGALERWPELAPLLPTTDP